ncbi:aminotransferase class V-fold PLP-dependent enzyme [Candidatus Poribacteria bacterium]|nr:aminotransferase class V-fold PLP-dependent enzyme [Candidatus Poribacteria bacterium]
MDRHIDWSRFRDWFPVTRRFAYFNHAGVSPMPLPVYRELKAFMDDALQNGSVNYRRWLETAEDTRRLLASMINARPDEIAFVKNTTHGILIAANGIRWKSGDNVIITEAEFPANVYPWLNLARRGVETRFARQRDGRIPFEEIERLVDDRTRVISISFVEFVTGYRNDLKRIGELCRDRDIIFVVDAIQGMGALGIDVKGCNVDILSSDAHKWLLGPEGIACFYCSRERLDDIENVNVGWMSVIDESNYLNYDLTQKPDARRFEEGSYNMLGIHALHAAVRMLTEIGIPNIERRILSLTDMLAQGLREKGYRLISPMGKGERSGILTFCSDRFSSGELVKMLFENGVVTAHRSGYVRVSPHFYNSEDEIRKLLDLLPDHPVRHIR